MSLSTRELTERLDYPAVWHDRGLYLDALYRVQLAAFVSEAEGHGVAPATYRPTGGSEHYRYGAFGFWLQREPGPEIVDALMEAAIADPDPRMASVAMNDILAAYRPSVAMLELAIRVVRQSRRYSISADALAEYLRGETPPDGTVPDAHAE